MLYLLPESMREKGVKFFCNNFDLKSDYERQGIIVFANPTYSDINLKLSSRKSDFAALAKCYDGLMIGTFPGDFFDRNDGYPILTLRSSRHRVYIMKPADDDNWELVRYELTQDNMYNKVHISIPKL